MDAFVEKMDKIQDNFVNFSRQKEIVKTYREERKHARKPTYYLCGKRFNQNEILFKSETIATIQKNIEVLPFCYVISDIKKSHNASGYNNILILPKTAENFKKVT